MTKSELEKKVEELEKANNILAFDLEWERLSTQKRLEVCASANRKNKKVTRKTQQVRKQAGNGSAQVHEKIERDAFGQRVNTLSHQMNVPIIALIEKEKYDRIQPEILSQMTGGQIPVERFKPHLGWLKKKGLI